VSFLQEANKALRAIAAVARADELAQLAGRSGERRTSPEQERAIERLRGRAHTEAAALNEVGSKELLRIGYPVVLKAVSAALTHKSEAGAVALDLSTPAELTAACERMARALEPHALAGMLVCQQIRGGLELVLGLHRDPEVGLVLMAGSGGVLIELVKDVVFCIPPVSLEKAHHMISRTRAAQLMNGYRGCEPLDRDAVAAALVALGQLAEDIKDVIK
jgi:acyl-CoA synthetase (NDP forming)